MEGNDGSRNQELNGDRHFYQIGWREPLAASPDLARAYRAVNFQN